MPVDFFARGTHFIDHLLPVWNELDGERGRFFVPWHIVSYAKDRGVDAIPVTSMQAQLRGTDPLMVCAYGDLYTAHQVQPKRKFIFMEHGVGITYGGHPAYAGGIGYRSKVSLFLAPNEMVRAKTEKALPGVKQVVIGTPKLDWVSGVGFQVSGQKPVVCISFHWDGKRVQPEAGNAFEHYRKALPALVKFGQENPAPTGFTLIGHGHPRAIEDFAKVYQNMGIEVVRDFDEVMRRADVYVCDNSSTIYEFCITGKPVVILNAPHYRRKVHWGIRFWEYTDVGLMVDRPEDLTVAILSTLANLNERKEEREKAIADLYPFLGESAKRAAKAIRDWRLETEGHVSQPASH